MSTHVIFLGSFVTFDVVGGARSAYSTISVFKKQLKIETFVKCNILPLFHQEKFVKHWMVCVKL